MAAYSGESSNFLSSTFLKLNDALNTFVTSFSTNIATEIAPLVGGFLTLSFIILGIMAVRGMLDNPFLDVAAKMMKVSIIVTIALSAPAFQEYVSSIFLTLPDDLITSIISRSVQGTTVTAGQGAAQAIEQLYTLGSYNAGLYFNEAGMTNLPPMFYGSLVWIGTVMCVMMGALWLFISKVVLSLMLGVAPIFIVMLAWQPTQQYFFSWLGVVFNTIITSIFVVAIFSIFSGIFQAGLNNLVVDNTSEGFMNAAVYAFLGLLCMGVLMVIPQYVSQLTGAAGGAVGQAMSRIVKASGGAAASVAGSAGGAVSGGARASASMPSARAAFQASREGGAGKLESLNKGRQAFNVGMSKEGGRYPDYFRNQKSNTQK